MTVALGALLSPFKRPRADADFPRTPVVTPGLRVDLARLAAYERVCGFPTGPEALPVTYPHVLGFPSAMRLMSGRNFPLPLLGLVHTSIEITQRERLAVLGEYELTVHVSGLAPHRRGTEASVVTELRGGGGVVVWESRSTYLARHGVEGAGAGAGAGAGPGAGAGAGADAGPGAGAGPGPGAGAGAGAGPGAGAGADAGPGTGAGARKAEQPALPVVAEWRLAADVGRRYAAVSGDRNPIHLHPLAARLFGFPRAIAHGMWTVARCLAAHGVPDAAQVRAEFRAPVLLPGTVVYGAERGRFELRGEDGRLHLEGAVS